MIWFILFLCGVSIVVSCIICEVVQRKIKKLYWDLSVWIASGIAIASIAILIWGVGSTSYMADLNQFKTQKVYMESHREETMQNATMTMKKIEYNEWLVNEQYWYNNYYVLSFADKEIMELDPIE